MLLRLNTFSGSTKEDKDRFSCSKEERQRSQPRDRHGQAKPNGKTKDDKDAGGRKDARDSSAKRASGKEGAKGRLAKSPGRGGPRAKSPLPAGTRAVREASSELSDSGYAWDPEEVLSHLQDVNTCKPRKNDARLCQPGTGGLTSDQRRSSPFKSRTLPRGSTVEPSQPYSLGHVAEVEPSSSSSSPSQPERVRVPRVSTLGSTASKTPPRQRGSFRNVSPEPLVIPSEDEGTVDTHGRSPMPQAVTGPLSAPVRHPPSQTQSPLRSTMSGPHLSSSAPFIGPGYGAGTLLSPSPQSPFLFQSSSGGAADPMLMLPVAGGPGAARSPRTALPYQHQLPLTSPIAAAKPHHTQSASAELPGEGHTQPASAGLCPAVNVFGISGAGSSRGLPMAGRDGPGPSTLRSAVWQDRHASLEPGFHGILKTCHARSNSEEALPPISGNCFAKSGIPSSPLSRNLGMPTSPLPLPNGTRAPLPAHFHGGVPPRHHGAQKPHQPSLSAPPPPSPLAMLAANDIPSDAPNSLLAAGTSEGYHNARAFSDPHPPGALLVPSRSPVPQGQRRPHHGRSFSEMPSGSHTAGPCGLPSLSPQSSTASWTDTDRDSIASSSTGSTGSTGSSSNGTGHVNSFTEQGPAGAAVRRPKQKLDPWSFSGPAPPSLQVPGTPAAGLSGGGSLQDSVFTRSRSGHSDLASRLQGAANHVATATCGNLPTHGAHQVPMGACAAHAPRGGLKHGAGDDDAPCPEAKHAQLAGVKSSNSEHKSPGKSPRRVSFSDQVQVRKFVLTKNK